MDILEKIHETPFPKDPSFESRMFWKISSAKLNFSVKLSGALSLSASTLGWVWPQQDEDAWKTTQEVLTITFPLLPTVQNANHSEPHVRLHLLINIFGAHWANCQIARKSNVADNPNLFLYFGVHVKFKITRFCLRFVMWRTTLKAQSPERIKLRRTDSNVAFGVGPKVTTMWRMRQRITF